MKEEDRIKILKKYYEDLDYSKIFDVLGKDFFKFRQIKILLSNGSFTIPKRRVRKPDDLKKIILSNFTRDVYPKKIYYCIGKYLNPTDVRYKKYDRICPGYNIANNLFLGNDILVVDIDATSMKELNDKITVIYPKMREKYLKPFYACFSGRRGVHIASTVPFNINVKNPISREEKYTRKAKNLVKDVVDQEHVCVSSNQRQIFRIPLCVDAKTGHVCEFIPIENILNFKILNIYSSERIHPFEYDSRDFYPLTISKDKARTGLIASPNTFEANIITNRIKNTKDRCITFLDYQHRNKVYVTRRIKKIQNDYGEGDMFLFKTLSGIHAIGLKSHTQRRVEKIMKASGCDKRLTGCQRNFGRTFLRINNKMSMKGEVSPAPVYIGCVMSKNTDCPVSLGHYNFLKNVLGIPVYGYENFVGGNQVKISDYEGEV